jgi:hypothetical protein
MGSKTLKKPRKHQDALEAGFCTAKKCRQYILSGQGNQIVIGNVLHRFCWKDWQKLFEEK